MQTNKYILDLCDYEKLDLIGHGSFGEVFMVREKKTGMIYAAKISISSIKANSNFMRETLREINILSRVYHPSIIKFIGVSPTNFEKEPKPVIITEYFPNGSLKKLIDLSKKSRSPEKWNDTRKLITLYGIASGMAFLHSNNIMHRDLKPENILFDKYLLPMICDFGLSKEENSIDQSLNSIKGTPIYIAPEIINDADYTTACDVYSFAIIAYQLFVNEDPFPTEKTPIKIYQKIAKGYRPEIFGPVDSNIVEMIKSCWEQNPSDRLTFDQIKETLKDPEFYSEMLIDEDVYNDYIDFVDGFICKYDENGPKFTPEDFQESKKFKKIVIQTQEESESDSEDSFDDYNSSINSMKSNSSRSSSSKSSSSSSSNKSQKNHLCPKKVFHRLKIKCRMLVAKADTNANAQFKVGKLFIEGEKGFPKNVQLGVSYLNYSIENGNCEALHYYCRMLIDGTLIDKDIEKAYELLENDEDQDSSANRLLRGLICLQEEDYEKARIFFDKGSKGGNGEAMYQLGMLYYKGLGVRKDKIKANKLFELAKKNNFVILENNTEEEEEELSAEELYQNAIQCRKASNVCREIFYLIRAAKKDHITAMNDLGDIYLNGKGSVPVNYIKAKKYYKMGMDHGDQIATFKYASMQYNGQGLQVNKKEAAKLFKLAADKGNKMSMFKYAEMLEKGDGIPSNLDESIKYYQKAASRNQSKFAQSVRAALNRVKSRKSQILIKKAHKCENEDEMGEARQLYKQAADLNCLEGMIKYSEMCEEGIGGPQKITHLRLYLKKAADKGDSNSMFKYAQMLEKGINIECDKNEAVRYYKLAADDENIDAMKSYGRCLERGIGVNRNPQQAKKYLQKAAELERQSSPKKQIVKTKQSLLKKQTKKPEILSKKQEESDSESDDDDFEDCFEDSEDDDDDDEIIFTPKSEIASRKKVVQKDMDDFFDDDFSDDNDEIVRVSYRRTPSKEDPIRNQNSKQVKKIPKSK